MTTTVEYDEQYEASEAPRVPTEARKPQDHQPPAPKKIKLRAGTTPDGVFWFEHEGARHEFAKPTLEVVDPLFIIDNAANPLMLAVGVLKPLLGKDSRELLANNPAMFRALNKVFQDHLQDVLGASLGE